jgi:plasmid replication initiation protein
LYENCVRFKNVKSTGWWDLEKFRRLMGAEAAMYDDFKRLSAFVVKKSCEEINAVSDIRVVPEYRREGRKVVAIRFAVEENPQQSLFGPNPLDDEELVAIRSSEAFQPA